MNKELTAPVAFIVFNRPGTTQRVFDEIRKGKPQELYVIADGPRDRAEGKKCDAARDIIGQVDWNCKVHKNYSDVNLGCKARVSSGLDWFFENVDAGIILEDDCVPDQSFFPFCEKMLERYRDDTRIMMISGTNYLFNKIKAVESYFFSKYYAIWGWATWRRAWKKYDANMNSWPEFRNNKQLSWVFSDKSVVEFYTNMFQEVYSNRIDSWGIPWAYSCIFQNGLAIVPRKNLISNIGVTGTHTGAKTSIFINMPVESVDTENIRHPAFVVPNVLCDQVTYQNVFMSGNKAKAIVKAISKQVKIDCCVRLIYKALKRI